MPPRFLLILALTVVSLAHTRAESPAPLAGQPRLLANAVDWARVRTLPAADPLARDYHAALLASARRTLELPPARYEKRGRRLLGVSREIVGRVLGLAYAWRTTGDTVFARRAESEMLAAANFPDWNPSHFLDAGEMTTALALGCDWLHDALTPEARATIHRAIVEKGLRAGLDPAAPHNWWHTVHHNWNQVCLAGLALGALEVAEEEPALARQILDLARARNGLALASYAPDGLYPEGPAYWSYGTTYQVLLLAGLRSALGDDWQLGASPGFLATAGAFLQTTAPSGRFYNYYDGGEDAAFQPALLWFARQTGDTGLLSSQFARLRDPANFAAALSDRFAVLAMLWWPANRPADRAPALPLRWLGRGTNPVAVFRESWSDPAALYLALKGGSASLNHAHMDAGSFVLEADGVRWSVELGMQDYHSLEAKKIDLWTMTQESQRWQVYRLNNHSHSTLTLDGRLHHVAGDARISHFSADPARTHAIVELTPIFAGQVASARRGFRLLPDRRVLVQDELTGLTPGTTVRWQMTTRAELACEGTQATLRQSGRTLRAQLLTPAGAAFTSEPAEPPADGFNAPNPGARLLVATATAPADGKLRVAIILTPGEKALPVPALDPLENWSEPADKVIEPSVR